MIGSIRRFTDILGNTRVSLREILPLMPSISFSNHCLSFVKMLSFKTALFPGFPSHFKKVTVAIGSNCFSAILADSRVALWDNNWDTEIIEAIRSTNHEREVGLETNIPSASGISFLRGMFNDLIGGTFNLKHFHGDRIWSVLCAVIASSCFLVTVPTAEAQGTAAAVAAGAAAVSANAALYFSRSQREENDSSLRAVNHMGAIDLSNRKICEVNQRSYLDVNNCRKGDVILINHGTLRQMMEICKPDDPIITYKGSFACTYEDHEKLFYTPKKYEKELPRIIGKD